MAEKRKGTELGKFSSKVYNRFGQDDVSKGSYKSKEGDKVFLWAWDFLEECQGEDCPLYEKCRYVKKVEKYFREGVIDGGKKYSDWKCYMHQTYLMGVIRAVMDKISNKKDMKQENVIKLGYQLIPLYSQLFKFKMWEYGNTELVTYSERGGIKVHPVYKEIREIIKAINGVWKTIGEEKRRGGPSPEGIGDEGFIEAITDGVGIEDEGDNKIEGDGEGVGVDFEAGGVKDEEPKRRDGRKRKRKKRKKKKKKKKREKEVLNYGSRKRKEKSKQEREGE